MSIKSTLSVSEKIELLARKITESWKRSHYYYTPVTIDKKYIVVTNSDANNIPDTVREDNKTLEEFTDKGIDD